MIIFKIFLLPFSLIYGLAIWIRNRFFDLKIFKSYSFNKPIISVGNISVGGTGKTPHVEYLINLFRDSFKIATLSRGYRRKTSGFAWVNKNDNYLDVGDEPLQYSQKFKDVKVAVHEDRVKGIKQIIKEEVDLILLDDAFQCRYVNPSVNILLTTYQKLYINDFFLPFGTLRDSKTSVLRADIIIVTKTPRALLPVDKKRLIEQISPWPHQKLYFSFYDYFHPKMLFSGIEIPLEEQKILLLTGICEAQSIKDYLLGKVELVEHLEYPDHYQYTLKDIQRIKDSWNQIKSSEKILLTTEKDSMRLQIFEKEFKDIPICYLPVKVRLHDEGEFNDLIYNYVR